MLLVVQWKWGLTPLTHQEELREPGQTTAKIVTMEGVGIMGDTPPLRGIQFQIME